MKNKVFKSFRFEIVLYSMLSLIYTVLTEVVIAFGIYIMYKILKEPEVKPIPIRVDYSVIRYNSNSYIPGNSVGTLNTPMWDSNVIWLMLGIALIIGIILFIFYFLMLTKKFVYYLEEISHGIEEMSSGNFKHKIHIKYDDEFGAIAEKINDMANNIEDIMEKERGAEDEKKQLITSVAHDLRTPLTSIIGYLDIVLRNQSISEDIKYKYINIAFNKSKGLEKLIEDLFTYTNYSFGGTTLNITPIDMVKFMEQLVDEFYPSFMEHNLECEFNTNTQGIILHVDGALLARALTNLIENAVKYGTDGKRIKIELLHRGEAVSIAITNYGRLIPQSELQNIFQRFYRVESSRSNETGGNGIGLAIVKSIIELHAGTIQVRSDLNGTVFEVILQNQKGRENIDEDEL